MLSGQRWSQVQTTSHWTTTKENTNTLRLKKTPYSSIYVAHWSKKGHLKRLTQKSANVLHFIENKIKQDRNKYVVFYKWWIFHLGKESHRLQAQNERLCTLHFVDLSCFTHRFLDDISIVVVILRRTRRITVSKESSVGDILWDLKGGLNLPSYTV